MTQMFDSLTVGLALSVVVILILLTGFFQSSRLGLISIGAVPGVICGVAIMLLLTGTTLNIESFMGSIMCIGVSVSNSVLLSAFMDNHWRAGAAAASRGRRGQRPLAANPHDRRRHGAGNCADGLGPGRGKPDRAPLGRAVIGGLVVSTFATLLIVPAMFALVMGDQRKVSPSVDPDDPQSPYHDAGEHVRKATHGGPRPEEHPPLPGAS